MALAKQAISHGSLISKGHTLISFLDEVQDKCNLDLGNVSCVVRNFPFFMEGERHTQMRQRVLKHMGTVASLKSWEDYFDTSLRKALNKIDLDQETDLVSAFIDPFLQEITCTLLGLTMEDPHKFRQCTDLAEMLLDPLLPIRALKQMETAFTDFFEEILSKEIKETESGTPLLAELLKKPVPGYTKKDTCAFVLVVYAGTLALRYTLANMIFHIVSGGETIKAQAVSKEWVNTHLEHLIRDTMAVRKVSRMAKENCRIGELDFEKGHTVFIDMQAAHYGAEAECPLHKGKKWDDETLDNKTHMAFGKGSHYCLGANFSKFILSKVLPELFTRYPDMRLVNTTPDLMEHTQILSVRTLKCYMRN